MGTRGKQPVGTRKPLTEIKRDKIADDLGWAAQRQLKNCYRQAGDKDERNHPELARVVKAIVGRQAWQYSPTLALIPVIRTAISHDDFPDKMNGRRPEYPAEKANPRSDWYGVPERKMAEAMFGYDHVGVRRRTDPTTGETVEEPQTYDQDCWPAIFAVAKLETLELDYKRKVTRVIRQDLAAILLQMEQEALQDQQQALASIEPSEPAGLAFTTDSSRDYTPRPAYQTQLTEHWEGGTRVFLLHGDAGTGKTTLARQFGHAYARRAAVNPAPATTLQMSGNAGGHRFVEIDTRTPEAMHNALARALHRFGADVPLHHALLRDDFKDLLASDEAPAAVLLDNVEKESWDDVKELIPAEPRCVVILTSRQRPTRKQERELPDGSALLPVGEMTDDEAVAMVISELPHVTGEDAAALIGDLGNRPLAIRHACGFIDQEGMSVGEFRRLLGEDIARFLDIVVDDEPTLTSIYRLTLGRLDDDAFEVLCYIAVLSNLDVSYDFIRQIWSWSDPISPARQDDSLEDLELKKILRELERRSLFTTVRYPGQGGAEFLCMHPLTARLLLGLCPEAQAAILKALLEEAEATTGLDIWPTGKSLPFRVSVQTPDLRTILAQLAGLALDDVECPRLARLAAFVIRGETQHAIDPDRHLNPVRLVILAYQRMARQRWGIELSEQPAAGTESPDDAEYQRRTDDWNTLLDELLHAAARFPRPTAASRLLDTVGVNRTRAIVPYLSMGVEHHPFVRAKLAEAPDDHGEPTAPYMAQLRRDALKARYTGRFFEAGNLFFALGTDYFDKGDYTCARASYWHAYSIWCADRHTNIGEVCKAAIRVADSYARLGTHQQAAIWREQARAHVWHHIREQGISEWTGDYAANYSFFKAVLSYPPVMALRPGRDLEPDSVNAHGAEEQPEHESDQHALVPAESGELTEIEAWFAARLNDAGIDPGNLQEFFHEDSVFAAEMKYTLLLADAAEDTDNVLDGIYDLWKSLESWPLMRVKLMLAQAKIAMYSDEMRGTRYCSQDTLRGIVQTAYDALDQRSLYWFADCLLTVYVLCARYSCGDEDLADKFFRHLRVVLHEIGRRDRLDIALAAKEKPEPDENEGSTFNPLWLLAE